MKKKILAVSSAIMALALSVTGMVSCGGNNDNSESSKNSSNGTGSLTGTVTLSGSTSVQPLMEALELAFEAKNSGVNITVSGGGSGKGVSDAKAGNVDFGMASRDLKSSETGITAHKIATDGIAVIANKNCTITNVSMEELFNLYAYGTTIQSVITRGVARTSTSGTRGAFDELIYKTIDGTKTALADMELANGIQEIESTGDVMTTIATAANTNMVGYISLGSVNNTIKALSFEGVAATVDNINNGTYTLSRPFNILTKDGKTLSAAAQAFYDFIMSTEGQTIIANKGYIKVA